MTPTSQIVGTQAVLNVLTGERYKSISKETQAILKGEYGAAPAAFDADLQARVLEGSDPITCRPGDLLEPEVEKLTEELSATCKEKGIELADEVIDDVLTYALFPQVGLKFLENRGNPDAFEPAPSGQELVARKPGEKESYTVTVAGSEYVVEVADGGDLTGIKPVAVAASTSAAAPAAAAGEGEPMPAPLAGNIWKVHVQVGDRVEEGDLLLILEAMKMETEVRAPNSGHVTSVDVSEGDSVQVGDTLLTLA